MFFRASFVASLLAVLPQVSASAACRCFPNDPCWPTEADWSQLNDTIDGRLVKTVPLGAPCHAPSYNSETCAVLKDGWLLPEEHYESSSSIMAPFFAEGACDPFHPISKPCTLGNYVRYSVNVTSPAHISNAVKFATQHNIRLVIRNTGHDYNGRSTGAGALAIWTHHLKELSIGSYNDTHYNGKAITMGAGVQGHEAYELAEKTGYQVVGGECPTVGLAGGYTQGGGHSALGSRYGLAADQVLKWEVIDGQGNFITATRDNEYSDIFWALSGGGAGTYGVVWSMTSKAHPGTPVSGLNLTYTNEGISQDTFYSTVETFHAVLPAIVDAGAMSVWYFTNTSFSISPITGPNIPVAELVTLLKPFTDSLDKLSINYTTVAKQYESYYSQFQDMQGVIEVGTAQYGGWLVPRSVVQNNNHGLLTAYREITEAGGTFIGVGLNVSHKVSGDVFNAVLPAWREALIDTTLTTPWEWNNDALMLERQRQMTEDFIPKLTALSPESGAYMNEGNFQQPNFKEVFYGTNYNTLRSIKAKYDPNDIFYARTAVGSDEWTESEDGRLCKAT
ncbi:FAD/FMN-containing isoamyl alcohol oxidase MreA [Penicillium digitatum]|uniref:FAD/FMN-containing isoamyl alcohol oxidase MreA n=3 Tax=Penicillium digitatum TaxID=36651 RepID=K9FXQ3_PEND2|nr:FAD/FMN-containing isoamyl alcohol oxidase MreA [Penicillium digitatum Pd1]EKV12585.1 FAD/FMN-containing isoamyl alcohol oxidase MreA [Penicillium digitatum Pd1]EKV14500.1 FAD/FMN-containing isoamyl alcohol oxidase MreA [Penicillium digitatum PHI26]QQK43272.1 FAD/FMN-containing isoamyl alcohol oxidase MreA [Penicillium digitatum]